jgi:glycerol-3-phosphate dehydrogenase subunit B
MAASNSATYDLCIIGTGMTGMAAALFAAHRGLSVLQVGSTGEMLFASGLLDLLGVHPIEQKKTWRDPWAGIEALRRDLPRHPYACLKQADIQAAFDELIAFLNTRGLNYIRHRRHNQEVVTSMGTTKLTYGLPLTMWNGVAAFRKKTPCLVVDFRGLKGFSARQIALTLAPKWPAIDTLRVDFPGLENLSEVYPERLARALEVVQNREHLARAIKPHLKNARVVGLPPILGINHSREVMTDLADRIGVPLFEIPTMPPSVAGLRLKETFEQHLPSEGTHQVHHKQVLRVRRSKGGIFLLEVGVTEKEFTFRSQGVVLATGRFIGQGLHAGRKKIRETVFNLPVAQPQHRAQWHRLDFLDPRGHPINQAGLEIDAYFRPLQRNGQAAFDNLFAAGSILAHHDWMRMKCGSGLAIATAYAAVNAFITCNKAKNFFQAAIRLPNMGIKANPPPP